MSWPSTLAAKLISGFIAERFGLDAITIRRFNPPMGAMPFFNNSASQEIRKAELTLFAGTLLKFLKDLSVPLEGEGDEDQALTDLVDKMVPEDAPSSGMVEAVDKHFHFKDE